MSISNKEQPSSLLKLIVIQSRMFRFRQFRTLTYIWRTAGRTAYGVGVQRPAQWRNGVHSFAAESSGLDDRRQDRQAPQYTTYTFSGAVDP